MNLFMIVKSTLKHFSFIRLSSGLYEREKIVAWTMMDVFMKIMGKEKVCTEKDS